LPQVTKCLIHDSFFASVKAPELAGKEGEGIESPVIDSIKKIYLQKKNLVVI
jgi:hypothetical protein